MIIMPSDDSQDLLEVEVIMVISGGKENWKRRGIPKAKGANKEMRGRLFRWVFIDWPTKNMNVFFFNCLFVSRENQPGRKRYMKRARFSTSCAVLFGWDGPWVSKIEENPIPDVDFVIARDYYGGSQIHFLTSSTHGEKKKTMPFNLIPHNQQKSFRV